MPNRINPEEEPLKNEAKTTPDSRDEDKLLAEMIKSVTEYAKRTGYEVHGHFGIRNGTPEGLNVCFQAFPSKDFFLWFIEDLHFTLIALVDEKLKTIAKMTTSKAQEFYNLVQKVAYGMEEKNKKS